MRKRTIGKLKVRYKISITPIPKVWVKIQFRKDGSWHWGFGYKSRDYLVSNGLYWDEQGNRKWTGKSSYSVGQDYVINRMWQYIREQAYYNNIHELDLV
jgi:hypothetical protein